MPAMVDWARSWWPPAMAVAGARERSSTDASAARMGRACRSPALRAIRTAPCSGDELSMAEEAGAGIGGARRVEYQSPGGPGSYRQRMDPEGRVRRGSPAFRAMAPPGGRFGAGWISGDEEQPFGAEPGGGVRNPEQGASCLSAASSCPAGCAGRRPGSSQRQGCPFFWFFSCNYSAIFFSVSKKFLTRFWVKF